MEANLIHKVYDFVHQLIHLNENRSSSPTIKSQHTSKTCPVTGLDIWMQPKNSKFLSYTGVKWYYENAPGIYKNLLSVRLNKKYQVKKLDIRFKKIAHNIRNTDSNPRNNTLRQIKELLKEDNCLFNNLDLIDKTKLHKAGITTIQD